MNTDSSKGIHILYFNTRDELIRVDLRNVGYFKADRNYTDVYFLNGYHVTLPTSLVTIEKMLDDDRMKGRTMPFVRIGRSVIVNLRHIVHINVLKQELVICDMRTTCVLKVEVQKEALKKLKELYNQKESK